MLTALQLGVTGDLLVALVANVAEEPGRNGEIVFSITDQTNLQQSGACLQDPVDPV